MSFATSQPSPRSSGASGGSPATRRSIDSETPLGVHSPASSRLAQASPSTALPGARTQHSTSEPAAAGAMRSPSSASADTGPSAPTHSSVPVATASALHPWGSVLLNAEIAEQQVAQPA